MDANFKILENNVRASFSNTKTDVLSIENAMKQSFANAKADIAGLQGKARQHDETLRQFYDYIKKLNDNQRALLVRIRELEKKAAERIAVPLPPPPQRIMEKKIILTSPKVVSAPRQGKQYLASSSSMKVHDKVCPFAKNIKPKNKMVFRTKAKAFNMGYKPCDCMKRV